jgi:hypothetical protein
MHAFDRVEPIPAADRNALPRPPRGPEEPDEQELPEGDPPDEVEIDDPDDEEEGEEDDPPLYGGDGR